MALEAGRAPISIHDIAVKLQDILSMQPISLNLLDEMHNALYGTTPAVPPMGGVDKPQDGELACIIGLVHMIAGNQSILEDKVRQLRNQLLAQEGPKLANPAGSAGC